jgi:hypothetical protein
MRLVIFKKGISVPTSVAVVCISMLLGTSASGQLYEGKVQPLAIKEVALPPLGVAHYRTSGVYPQVSGSGANLNRVNEALKSNALKNESAFAAVAAKENMALGTHISQFQGRYDAVLNVKYASASTKIVSTMEAIIFGYPGGEPSATWDATSINVESGDTIGVLKSLFARPKIALAFVANRVHSMVLTGNSETDHCVQQMDFVNRLHIGKPIGNFSANSIDYKYLSLTATGLMVGFNQGQVAADACGSVATIVPFSELRHYFSKNGAGIVRALRQPASK